MPDEPDLTPVHARYLGDSPVVMPELAGRDRCCQKANQREGDTDDGIHAHTLLEHGDVILLDRFSAEGRADFELVQDEPRAKTKTVKES